MACVYIIIFICDSELENRIHLFRHYNITMYECNKQSEYVLCIRSIGFNIITMTSIVWMLLLLWWFFFFAPSFVLYLIYVVSRSIGVRNRNAIYTYICWSSILAWPTINTVCLFPALYHTILYFYSVVVCASNDSSYTSDCSVQFLNVYFLFGGAQEYCESKRVRQALCKCAQLHGVRMRHNESNQLKCRE